MALEFRRNLDPASRDLLRDGRLVGHVEWPEGELPYVEMVRGHHLTLAEMRVILTAWERREIQCPEKSTTPSST